METVSALIMLGVVTTIALLVLRFLLSKPTKTDTAVFVAGVVAGHIVAKKIADHLRE